MNPFGIRRGGDEKKLEKELSKMNKELKKAEDIKDIHKIVKNACYAVRGHREFNSKVVKEAKNFLNTLVERIEKLDLLYKLVEYPTMKVMMPRSRTHKDISKRPNRSWETDIEIQEYGQKYFSDTNTDLHNTKRRYKKHQNSLDDESDEFISYRRVFGEIIVYSYYIANRTGQFEWLRKLFRHMENLQKKKLFSSTLGEIFNCIFISVKSVHETMSSARAFGQIVDATLLTLVELAILEKIPEVNFKKYVKELKYNNRIYEYRLKEIGPINW